MHLISSELDVFTGGSQLNNTGKTSTTETRIFFLV